MNHPDGVSGTAPTPLFSVITATYNCRDKIGATIESVLTQDPALFEYIVIDGNSRDGTLDEVRKHGPALRWISEPDHGVYDAMNKGVQAATGRFLYFIGAGDTLRPGILQRVAARIRQSEWDHSADPCFVYGNVFSEEMQKTYGGATGKWKLSFQNICHQAIFYDRRIFARLGTYDLKYRILADYHLNLRCYGAKWIRRHYIGELIANYQIAGLSSARDRQFQADQSAIIRQSLGLTSLLVFKLRHHWLRFYTNHLAPKEQA